MIFAISFLGALFAILASLLIVYTYVALRLIPRIKKSLRAFIAEMGPRALFERSGVDPAQLMRDLEIDVVHPSRRAAAAPDAKAPREGATNAVRVIFTCEDHGRCVGCPKVLAQFEAIARHQGAESFDEVERKCYEQLREKLKSDVAIADEDEIDRQHRIATQVIEALVVEGIAAGTAREAVWSRRKEDRVTFAGWLSAARDGCQRLSTEDKGNVA